MAAMHKEIKKLRAELDRVSMADKPHLKSSEDILRAMEGYVA